MILYKFNCLANQAVQYGEVWATSRYDVQRHVVATFPYATDIDIFLATFTFSKA